MASYSNNFLEMTDSMFTHNSSPFTYNTLLHFASPYTPKSYTMHQTEDIAPYRAWTFLFTFLAILQGLFLFK